MARFYIDIATVPIQYWQPW